MLRILFLILILMSSLAFAQTAEKPESSKFFEFGKISKSLLNEKFENFQTELKKENSLTGYVLNYGSPKDVAKRERQIREKINGRCGSDCPKFIFINGGDAGKLKTEFWIVPAGAEPPKP